MADFVFNATRGYGAVAIGGVEYQIRGLTRPVVDAVAERQREARRLHDAPLAADQVAAVMIGVIDAHLRAPTGAQPAGDALQELWHDGALTVDHHLQPIVDHLKAVTV